MADNPHEIELDAESGSSSGSDAEDGDEDAAAAHKCTMRAVPSPPLPSPPGLVWLCCDT
jgi:hypothetical protein